MGFFAGVFPRVCLFFQKHLESNALFSADNETSYHQLHLRHGNVMHLISFYACEVGKGPGTTLLTATLRFQEMF